MNSHQTKIDYILKDFSPNLDHKEVWVDSGFGNGTKTLNRFPFELPKKYKIRFPFIVLHLFKNILNYPTLPRFEKVAWEIPIKFKGFEYVIAHRKFGFVISASYQSDDLAKAAIDVMKQINLAIPLVEKLILPIVKEQVNNGQVTLESEFTVMHNRYLFFRDKLNPKKNKEYKLNQKKAKNFSFDKFDKPEDAMKAFEEINRIGNAASYYLYAMIDSYFSLLEHISVLLIPFCVHINMETFNIADFIGKNWKKKLQLILNHQTDKTVNLRIEILEEIKENIRNPKAHGNFLKNGRSFYVHMPSLGAIPFTLTKSKQNYKFSNISNEYMTIEDVCNHFDNFDKYLESSKIKYGIMYLKNDLPIPYDKKSATTFRRRLRTEKSTQNYINEIETKLNNSRNMDW